MPPAPGFDGLTLNSRRLARNAMDQSGGRAAIMEFNSHLNS
jgi:hypothetical protein